MKELIIYPFNYRGKTEHLIASRFSGSSSGILYIAPHTSKLRDFKIKYHLCRRNEALLPGVHTLKTLALNIIDEFSSCRIISEVEQYMSILHILKDNPSGSLSSQNLSGLAIAILRLIRDIKISSEGDSVDYGRIKDEIKSFSWKFGQNMDVLHDAVGIMEKYQENLQKKMLIDNEDLYREAAPHVGKIPWNRLFAEGFYEIPPYQKKFVEALIQKMDNVSFSLCYDENLPVDSKELIVDKTMAFLENTGKWTETRLESGSVKTMLECFSFSSQSEEIKGMVKMIWEGLRDKRADSFDDIMLVFPSMLKYRPVVQRIFGRYKLPCEITPGYSLSRDSSVSSLLEFFRFQDSFDWDSLMSVITSPHFKRIDMKTSEEFSLSTRTKFERTGFFKDNFFRQSDRNSLAIKGLLKKTAGTLKSGQQWVSDIDCITDSLGWEPGMPEVQFSFERVMEALKTGTVFSREEFISVLMKSFELVDIQEGKGHGVKVSGVLESVGVEKKMCFIGGATDDSIPQAPSVEEVFMPDRLKRKLGFTDYKLRIARERFDMHRLQNENERVIFTYPSKIEGENRMKSIFLFGMEDKPMKESFHSSAHKDIFAFRFSREKFLERFMCGSSLKLSVTQLERFMRCSYSFYLENVEGIRIYSKPEINEAPELWGTVIHRAMQKVFNPYKGMKMDENLISGLEESLRQSLADEIERCAREEGLADFYRDVMLMRKGEIISRFNTIMSGHTGTTLLGVEEEISMELPGIQLKGKIDRIESSPDGTISIIDIKTGTSSPPTYTSGDFFKNGNMQIPLYLWMYMKKHGVEPGRLRGNIWSFNFQGDSREKPEKFYPPGKLDYLERIEDFINKTAESMKSIIDFGPENPQGCFFCKYKGMCPYEKK